MTNLEKNDFKLTLTMTEECSREKAIYDKIQQYSSVHIANRLYSQNYYDFFTLLKEIEFSEITHEMYQYDLVLKFNDIERLTNVSRPKDIIHKIKITDLADKLSFLMEGDKLWICAEEVNEKNRRVHGTVIDVKSNFFIFELEKKLFETVSNNFRVHFLPNSLTFQMETKALEIAKSNRIWDFLFPATNLKYNNAQLNLNNDIKWFNKDIETNEQQCQAVEKILNNTSYPAPYLLFGPPGTGKTKTIVEAIYQITQINVNARILVCAQSNSACDEIASRLITYWHNSDTDYFDKNIYRLYASSTRKEPTDEKLFKYSNFGLFYYPNLDSLYKYKVICCTLTVAGRLSQADINSSHFTHLFIDECGSSTETAALIPIAVCSSVNKIHANIILSGDPKQLGPVIKSKKAEQLGLGQSLLERLMQRVIYRKDPVSMKYNSNFLTKLVKNYRSHSSIIKIPNDLFYDGELKAYADKSKSDLFLGWKCLPVLDIPIIFDNVVGNADQEKEDTSWFNNSEIKRVLFYVKLLLLQSINGRRFTEEDIGIISPYKAQCKKIVNATNNCGFNKIMTSSVELFQGKEKPIIIVSTVKSKNASLGFVKCPRRLNVLLTRAQALLIVIGDAGSLRKNQHWSAFIEYCDEKKVIIDKKVLNDARRNRGIRQNNRNKINDNQSKSDNQQASRNTRNNRRRRSGKISTNNNDGMEKLIISDPFKLLSID